MDRFVLFFVLLALSPGRGQVICSKKSKLKYVAIVIFSLLCLEVSELQKKNTEEVGSVSSSRSMEDILEENAALKYQNKWLIDVITKNISELSSRIQKNTEEVSFVSEEVSFNSNLIQKNTEEVSSVSEEVSLVQEDVSSAK